MKTVAILCAAKNSVYHSMPGRIVFDKTRDARSYQGNNPIVAHPPCRSWSAFCRHQAKPEPGEKELGPICVEQVKRCGGILEHPAHSHLWNYCNLPKPSWKTGDIWSIEVAQVWWGFSQLKRTWLLFVGIHPSDVKLPIRLHGQGNDRKNWRNRIRNSRSTTTPAFADWLVALARKAA